MRHRTRNQFAVGLALVAAAGVGILLVRYVHPSAATGEGTPAAVSASRAPSSAVAASAAADALQDLGAPSVSDAYVPGYEPTRRLGWALEETGTELIVAPALADIAGPPMHTRPVAGLPLIHVESAVFGGRKARIKAGIDRTAAALALIIASPVITAIARAVATTSKGSIFFC